MSESSWAALVGVAVYLGLRLIDYTLPSGRHWRWIERWTNTNPKKKDDPANPEDEKG